MPHGVNRIYSSILQIHSLIGNMSIRVDFKKHTIEFVLIFFGFGLLFGYIYIKLKCTPWRKARTISLSYLYFWAVVQLLSHVWLFATSWTAARQAFPVLHCVPEFAQTHVHWVSDAIKPSQPLLPPPLALNLSQHQGIFQWVGSLHQLAKVPCLIRLENCYLSLVISLINTKPLGSILFYFSSTIILLFMMNITTFFL